MTMKRIILLILTSILLTACAVKETEARTHHRRQVITAQSSSSSSSWASINPMFQGFSFQKPLQPTVHESRTSSRVARLRESYGNVQMLAHPAGCPRRAFCGCGAAVEVFGEPRRDLWLAANWLRFPRTAAAPGMVAARRGHVFVLKSQDSNGNWIVADHNSGGGLSRLHTRSLAGYTVVNPRG